MIRSSLFRVKALFSEELHPTSPQDGRSRERYRLILLAITSSAAGRVIAILTSVISIPLTLNYLGDERFAVWVTLSTFNMLLNFADLGIGNGLLTAVAHSAGRNDKVALKENIASGMGALSVIGLLLLIAALTIGRAVDWPSVFSVSGALAREEATPSAIVFLACFAVSIPANAIYRIQSGLQRAWVGNVAQCLGGMGSLCAVILCIHFRQGLPLLVFALTATPIAIALVNCLLFFRHNPDLVPDRSHMVRRTLMKLLSDGGMFLILQICVAVVFQSNPLIIARLMGAEAVTDFALPDRLFSFVTTMVCIGLGPLWPAYGDAIVRADFDWLRRTFRRSIVYSVTATIALATALIFAGPAILNLWLGRPVDVPPEIYPAQALWRVVEVLAFAMATLLNGSNRLRIQVLSAMLTAAISIVLRIELIKWLGLSGASFGLSISYIVIALPLLAYACSRVLRRPDA